MQNNYEHGNSITDSYEHPDRDNSSTFDIQSGKMEDHISQVVLQQSSEESHVSNGYPFNSLSNNEVAQNSVQEIIIPKENIHLIISEVDRILDEICLSDDEETDTKEGIKNNNFISRHEYQQEKKKITELYEEDESMNKYTGTRNELEMAKEIPIPFELTNEDLLIEAGMVDNTFEDKIMVKANTFNGILDLDNIIFNENKFAVGYLDDVIGKVEAPYYVIKFFPNLGEDARASMNLIPGKSVFFSKTKSKQILPKILIKHKGCDASNVFDEEINEADMEFSDDEEEVMFKSRKKHSKQEKMFDFKDKISKKPKVEEPFGMSNANKSNPLNNPMFAQEYKLSNFAPINNNVFANQNNLDMSNYSQMINFMMMNSANGYNPMMQNMNFNPNLQNNQMNNTMNSQINNPMNNQQMNNPMNNIMNGGQNMFNNPNFPSVNPFHNPYKK